MKQKSLYLPSRADETANPASNYARSDWTEIERTLPELGKDPEEYKQTFKNFESGNPVEATYSHSVSET